MTISTDSRSGEQARRVRMAAVAAGFKNAKELHRALEAQGSTVHYETVRRIWAGERKDELPFDLVKEISDATNFPRDFIVGEPVDTLPDWLNRAKGVWRGSQLAAAAA